MPRKHYVKPRVQTHTKGYLLNVSNYLAAERVRLEREIEWLNYRLSPVMLQLLLIYEADNGGAA